MKKVNTEKVENISLSAKQIKSKLEDSLAYDHNKYKNVDILFDTKPNAYYKLPFSDFKIAISEELTSQQTLLENLNTYINDVKLIEETEKIEELKEVDEDDINIIEEVCEFDEIEEEEEEEEEDGEVAMLPLMDRAKKPSLTRIKVVDVAKVIEKIKREAIEKNKGKPVITRRQINKMLKPYLIKKATSMDVDGIDDAMTSIDIYLNAVNKIANNNDAPLNENNNAPLELNIKDILEDLEK